MPDFGLTIGQRWTAGVVVAAILGGMLIHNDGDTMGIALSGLLINVAGIWAAWPR